MRMITSLQGSVATKYSPDEAAPIIGSLTRDVVAYLGQAYQFSFIPEVPPGLFANTQPFTFQSGKVSIGEQSYPINQLTFVTGALVLTAKDTDLAERLLKHIISTMAGQFDLQIERATRISYYQSSLSVEFAPQIGAQLQTVQNIVNQFIKRPDNNLYALKRLALGAGDVANIYNMQLTIDDIPNSDFVLERRPGEPYELNRFFSSAPLPTQPHQEMLEAIEAALAT